MDVINLATHLDGLKLTILTEVCGTVVVDNRIERLLLAARRTRHLVTCLHTCIYK